MNSQDTLYICKPTPNTVLSVKSGSIFTILNAYFKCAFIVVHKSQLCHTSLYTICILSRPFHKISREIGCFQDGKQ